MQVEKAIEEKQDWVDKHLGLVSATPLHADLPVTASQVMSEKGTFEALVNPIMNKPKPKPKVSYLLLFTFLFSEILNNLEVLQYSLNRISSSQKSTVISRQLWVLQLWNLMWLYNCIPVPLWLLYTQFVVAVPFSCTQSSAFDVLLLFEVRVVML